MTECPPGVHSLFDFCLGNCAEPVEDDVDLQALADEFDALDRASVARANAKREARLYPYDLEVS